MQPIIASYKCLMCVWSKFMTQISEICAAAFIDDTYLWTRFTNVAALQHAVLITEKWDT